MKLFTDYVLPFEIMGVLLLVGMIGVILLSKKNLR
jgi:NADH:ubiquinone oxidoreductase subunit 6 (subunit J)